MKAKSSARWIAGLSAVLASIAGPTLADTASTLGEYVGYTIAAKETIVGWVDEDEGKKGDSFEGCEYGRKILFDDGRYLTCAEYGYQYAYRPEAVLLVRSGRIIMIVDDDAYDMTQ